MIKSLERNPTEDVFDFYNCKTQATWLVFVKSASTTPTSIVLRQCNFLGSTVGVIKPPDGFSCAVVGELARKSMVRPL